MLKIILVAIFALTLVGCGGKAKLTVTTNGIPEIVHADSWSFSSNGLHVKHGGKETYFNFYEKVVIEPSVATEEAVTVTGDTRQRLTFLVNNQPISHIVDKHQFTTNGLELTVGNTVTYYTFYESVEIEPVAVEYIEADDS